MCGIAATRAVVTVAEDVKHRHLPQILSLLEKGNLPECVRNQAIGTFTRLAEAEAKVHSSSVETVHFHEVGANDAIIDVVGSLWAMNSLGVEKVYAAPLTLGSGLGVSAHGAIAYPAPAVMEILKGQPVNVVEGIGETTTPTGAAILAEVAQFVDHLRISPLCLGYGAGTKSFTCRPNLLRATIGQIDDMFEHDVICVGSSDIDNTRPEVFEYAVARLREAGAIDVTMVDVTMKKGRRGVRLEVLCAPWQRAEMSSIITSETGSLGVRWMTVQRDKLRRSIETVDTPWGPIRVKVADNGTALRAVPEYDDCRLAASKHDIPLLEVIDRVTALYYDQLRDSK